MVEPFPIQALGNWGPTTASISQSRVHNKYLGIFAVVKQQQQQQQQQQGYYL